MADPNSFTYELKDEFKEWMDLPRFSKEYIDGVHFFLDFAFTIGEPDGEEILCPCAKCANSYWRTRDVVYKHLICKGFVVGYRKWINHGEGLSATGLDADMDVVDPCDDIDNLLNDRFRAVVQEDGLHEGVNEDAKKFYKLVEDANQELYPGCENFSTLSFIIRLYLLKCLHGWSNASFTSLLELLKEAIPNLKIPPSFNKTKAMIKDLGLDYEKIPACPNDCMLYRGCYADKEFCHICGASRYIQYPSIDCEAESSKKPNVNAKILRHFPLIPRLQRMFMSSRTANTLIVFS